VSTIDEKTTFISISKYFNPAWFASVMGTAVVPLAISFFKFPGKGFVAMAFMALSMVMFALALGPWLFRFFAFREKITEDLNHPIAGNFFPTMPISLVVLSLDFLKYPEVFFAKDISHVVAYYLWIIGTIGIYIFGFVILTFIFRHKNIELSHANFGWYIPPVSKLIVPVAGLELAHVFPETIPFTFGVSMVSFGVGFFLFIFVGAAVYHRYIYHELPMSKFASTFFIGIAPTAIITVITFKMIHLFKAEPLLGNTADVFVPLAKLFMLINWGFSLWWFVMAIIVILYYIRSIDLPYALSWWAFTFPLGAQSVATGAVWKITGWTWVFGAYGATLLLMAVLWIVVSINTFKGILSGKIFKPAH
jgi:C4-dicarboxylate transporter/malic acid transport protein